MAQMLREVESPSWAAAAEPSPRQVPKSKESLADRNAKPHHPACVPRATEWQRIGNRIDAAMIFARADYLNVRTVPVIGRLWDCDDFRTGRNSSIDVGNQLVVEMCYDHSP
jgi:hypothetical protein